MDHALAYEPSLNETSTASFGSLMPHVPTRARLSRVPRPSLDVAVRLGNALDEMRKIPDASVHLIATDPPYFIDGMGSDWNKTSLRTRTDKAGVVGSLPVGMKFDPAQARAFQEFMEPIAKEAFRILKPGGFFIAFSQARLYHRLAVAAEDAGFEIRDMLAWHYEGQAKAFSMNHFIAKMKISDADKQRLIDSIGGRKTPQLKPQMEPMVMAQKPRVGTFVENWKQFETGLVDTTASLDGKFPGNVMDVAKPSRDEKGAGNEHLTVKPVLLMEHLIRLFSIPGQVVLDPFLGSGTTGVAAINTGREFIGVEIDPDYARIASKRIAAARENHAG
ncbi:DNA-methyltransferase [Burkholderia vietnamiensis]|uniref:DNA-methyltransferase n=1 Tax=Burkholderia vietnamiensis TaxID=60552 RepID=UPI001D144730|nr:site-specific DNA-methyltransferase [Burkholderia vietnamiensis]UEC01940.1 site-specific DNA-methyltransferase [Burkholderia vietnamiensis]